MVKKITPVKYTSRDFETIKSSIVEHAKRYYPDTFQDFSEASFGSLMVDAVSYIGDMVSFYLDYQVNEMFLDSAIEVGNIVENAKQLGYKFRNGYGATGLATFYILVPKATNSLGPDSDYLPLLKRGTKLTATGGAAYTLTEQVDFSRSENRVVVGTVNNTTGEPTKYAVRAYGEVVSGDIEEETFTLGDFIPLRKVDLSNKFITEVLEVFDSEGHRYFEVDYLSQDVIHTAILNRIDTSANAPKYLLKPRSVPRRFTVESNGSDVHLQFGYGSDSMLRNENFKSAADVVLKQSGKNYEGSRNFDPSNIVETDKLGVGPSNTTLTVVYRTNSVNNVNAPANTLTTVGSGLFQFPTTNLNATTRQEVEDSLQVNNDAAILGDISTPTVDDIKIRAKNQYASQNRAVTKADYEALIYRMPPKFGGIARCAAIQDRDSIKRNLNLYVISQGANGYYTTTNQTIKDNLKTWLICYKMINDTIDILDGRVMNFGIDFIIKSSPDANRFQVLDDCIIELKNYLAANPFDIGEPIYVGDIYKRLTRLDGVVDTTSVKINLKSGGKYASTVYNMQNSYSPDGTVLYLPEDAVFELKYPNEDIKGTVK